MNLVPGKVIYVDLTHIKANTNIRKFINEQVEIPMQNYIDELEESINESRKAHGQSPQKKEKIQEEKEIKVSTTDPESGFMTRDRRPQGFFYLNHMCVDGEYIMITGVHPTSAAINDAVPFFKIIEKQQEKFNVKYVGADAGYYAAPIAKGLEKLNMQGSIARRLGPKPKRIMNKLNFNYIEDFDLYVCLENHHLTYKTTTRQGYKEYITLVSRKFLRLCLL